MLTKTLVSGNAKFSKLFRSRTQKENKKILDKSAQNFAKIGRNDEKYANGP